MNGFGIEINTEFDRLIKYWNSLPHTPNHRLGTKLVKDATTYIKELKAGVFIVDKKLEVFCNKNKIPTKIPKMSSNDIKQGLEKLALIFNPSYWPKDKSRISNTLNSLIFNPYRKGYDNTSMFLKTYYHEPQLLSTEPNVEDTHPKITSQTIQTLTTNKDLSYGERCQLIRHIDAIYEINDRIDSKNHSENVNTVRYYYPKELPQNLVKAYAKFIQSQDWITNISVNTFDPNSKLFNKFLRNEEQDLEVKFGC